MSRVQPAVSDGAPEGRYKEVVEGRGEGRIGYEEV